MSLAYDQHFLQKDCRGYLCSVVSSSSEDLSTIDIPIVCDFPDELSQMSINREIEFSITPRTHLISKAPYCMAPTKLKELRTQL